MNNLAIFGAGGHGKVVADIALASNWQNIHFYDDSFSKNENVAWGIRGNYCDLLNLVGNYEAVIVAVGNNQLRWEKHSELKNAGANIATLVHPFSSVSNQVVLGVGTVIMPGVVINADVKIGEACIVNTGSTIDHDCNISEGSHICPGVNLAGSVVIGRLTFLGIGSSVCPSINIGSNVLIGAGSVVLDHVQDNLKIAGNPARFISTNISL